MMIGQDVETFNKPVDMYQVTVLLKCTFKHNFSTSVQELGLHTLRQFVCSEMTYSMHVGFEQMKYANKYLTAFDCLNFT